MEIDTFVKESLQRLGLESYVDNFIEHEIDQLTFINLTKEEIQVLIPGKLGPQKKLMTEVQKLQELRKGHVKKISTTISPQQTKSSQQGADDVKAPVVRRVTPNLEKVEGDIKVNESTRSKKVSSNRRTSVLELKEAEKGDPQLKTPPTDQSPSTLSKIISVGAPITLTILAGAAKREIIKNYTCPALNDLVNADFVPSTKVNDEIVTVQPSGLSTFKADGLESSGTESHVPEASIQTFSTGIVTQNEIEISDANAADPQCDHFDFNVNDVTGEEDCGLEPDGEEFLDMDDFYSFDPSELESYADIQDTVAEDIVDTITNALYAFFE